MFPLELSKNRRGIELNVLEILIAGIPIPRKKARDDALQGLRALRTQRSDRLGMAARDGVHDRAKVGARERMMARKQLVMDHAIGPDIAERIDIRTAE